MSTEPEQTQADALLAEYLMRLDAGEAVDRNELAQRCPELADELTSFFETGDLIDELAGPTTSQHTSGLPRIPGEHDEDTAFGAPLPRRFGPFELLEQIGRGGMGIVYRARRTAEDDLVAVKVLQSGSFASEIELKRFYKEARAAMRLVHDNIVRVHEVGDVDGRHYFSMELIEGRDLREVCRDNPLEPRVAAKILASAAEAIHAAHEAGILHRDIKPANILVDDEGVAHITDFGLAKHIGEESRLTTTGTAVGTPSYMSPEAARALDVDRRTDVYSLGAVLYAMLVGRPPFEQRTAMETILEVLHKSPTPPSRLNPEASPELETIALKCLEKDPVDRYPTALAVAEETQHFLAGRPIGARPIGLVRGGARWARHVPLIAALTGSVAHPTPRHRKAQWFLVAALLAALLAVFALRRSSGSLPMPEHITLASAVHGGEYQEIASMLGPILERIAGLPVDLLETQGSFENRDLLLGGRAHLALLQTGAIEPAEVAVVAPLYDDFVHVLARRSAGITSIADLAGRRVSIGLEGSGMQRSSQRLLRHFGVSTDELVEPYVHFTTLADDPNYVAAIITTGPRNGDLHRLLAGGEFDFVPIPEPDRESLAGPTFRQRTLHAGSYGTDGEQRPIPRSAIRTLATTTFLAVPEHAPDELVTHTLEALYLDSELVSSFDLFSLEQAAEWRMHDLHPAARRFFEQRLARPR